MERVEKFGRKTTPLEKGFAIVSGVLVGVDVAATLRGLPRSGLVELGGAIGLTGGVFVAERESFRRHLRERNIKKIIPHK